MRRLWRKKERNLRYNVVYGFKLHATIMDLRDENPEQYSQFRWPVVEVQSTNSYSAYRELSGGQNLRNDLTNHFGVTIYDLINGVREE